MDEEERKFGSDRVPLTSGCLFEDTPPLEREPTRWENITMGAVAVAFVVACVVYLLFWPVGRP